MKRLVLFIVITALTFLAGCSNEDSNPVVSSNTESGTLEKEPDWILLPSPSELTLKKEVSVGRWVNGSEETLLEINTGYPGGPHYWVSITANIRFKRNSFYGWRYITMSVDDGTGTATFSPSGSFSRPAIYNLTIMGLDLRGVNPNKVRFVYLAADGNYYDVQCQRIFVEVQSGKLQVIDAQIPHFSRFGFTR